MSEDNDVEQIKRQSDCKEIDLVKDLFNFNRDEKDEKVKEIVNDIEAMESTRDCLKSLKLYFDENYAKTQDFYSLVHANLIEIFQAFYSSNSDKEFMDLVEHRLLRLKMNKRLNQLLPKKAFKATNHSRRRIKRNYKIKINYGISNCMTSRKRHPQALIETVICFSFFVRILLQNYHPFKRESFCVPNPFKREFFGVNNQRELLCDSYLNVRQCPKDIFELILAFYGLREFPLSHNDQQFNLFDIIYTKVMKKRTLPRRTRSVSLTNVMDQIIYYHQIAHETAQHLIKSENCRNLWKKYGVKLVNAEERKERQ
eukprot:78560_1